jgi:hypothetical protein
VKRNLARLLVLSVLVVSALAASPTDVGAEDIPGDGFSFTPTEPSPGATVTVRDVAGCPAGAVRASYTVIRTFNANSYGPGYSAEIVPATSVALDSSRLIPTFSFTVPPDTIRYAAFVVFSSCADEWGTYLSRADGFLLLNVGGGTPRYENYQWSGMTPRQSAETVMSLSLEQFIREADSPFHDPRLNWNTDYCSGPDQLEFIAGGIWYERFWPACRRHDFGYRNFGGSGRLDPTSERRSYIDNVFRKDMNTVCSQQGFVGRQSCRGSAAAFYVSVHNTPWGHNAFFSGDPSGGGGGF